MDAARAWRWTLVGIGLAQATHLAALAVVRARFTSFYNGDDPAIVLAGLAAALWATEHARRGPRAAALPLVALVVAGLFAWWSGHLVADKPEQGYRIADAELATVWLQWAALFVPPALFAAHRAWRAAAVGGAGALLVLVGGALFAQRLVAGGWYEATAREGALIAVGTLACLIATALAWRARASPPPVRARIPAAALAGALVLALSWWRGGQLTIVVPLWIVAILLFAAPALVAWRARPVPAVATLALLVAGALVPVATCTHPYVTDVPRPDDPTVGRVEQGKLWEVAGRGPWWRQDDLFATWPVSCEPRLPALALAWLAAVAIVPALPPRGRASTP